MTRYLVISDPHIDIVQYPLLPFLVDLARHEEPDVIICTGDICNQKYGAERFLRAFGDFSQPKYVTWGNHDLWAFQSPAEFYGEAQSSGWGVADPTKAYEVIEGALIVNLFYTPSDTFSSHGNDLRYTNDHRFMNVKQYVRGDVELPDSPEPVAWSMSHMAPRLDFPSAFEPQCMFINPLIDEVIRAHESPLHFYGHTHEAVDLKREGVRYVNPSQVDAAYRRRQESFIIDG